MKGISGASSASIRCADSYVTDCQNDFESTSRMNASRSCTLLIVSGRHSTIAAIIFFCRSISPASFRRIACFSCSHRSVKIAVFRFTSCWYRISGIIFCVRNWSGSTATLSQRCGERAFSICRPVVADAHGVRGQRADIGKDLLLHLRCTGLVAMVPEERELLDPGEEDPVRDRVR